MLSEEEFRKLAVELAPKVNLFHDVWEMDPEASFYGGTSRDYLFWLKKEFQNTRNREEALNKVSELRNLPLIDVRKFIIGDSDVDVISKTQLEIPASRYGIRKFDTISPDVLDTKTAAGKNEIWQGHAPAEKIQIRKNEIQQLPELGSGLHEIYTGKLSVHFASPENFRETIYAKKGENHEILLALRYLRLQAINYFNTFGPGYPDQHHLASLLDPGSVAEVKRVIESVMDGSTLLPYLKNQRFHSWINGTISKAFRSYTNPTAALLLMKEFGVDRLSRIYGQEKIEPLNKYVFSKFRDQDKISAILQKFSASPDFYSPVNSFFPDGYLYHGAGGEEAFRAILFQGILPSTDGNAAGGLYGVAEGDLDFAKSWKGSTPDRVLKFPVKPSAKIVDITSGEGERVYRAYLNKSGGSLDTFAEDFGIDIIRYPYSPQAFVVKNSDALQRGQGLVRQLLTLNEYLSLAEKETDPEKILSLMTVNQVSETEADLVLRASKISPKVMMPAILKAMNDKPTYFPQLLVQGKYWQSHENLVADEDLLPVIEASVLSAKGKKQEEVFAKTSAWQRQALRINFLRDLKHAHGEEIERTLADIMNGKLGDVAPWLEVISRIPEIQLQSLNYVSSFLSKNYKEVMASGDEREKSFFHSIVRKIFGTAVTDERDLSNYQLVAKNRFQKDPAVVTKILARSGINSAAEYLDLINTDYMTSREGLTETLNPMVLRKISLFFFFEPSAEEIMRFKRESPLLLEEFVDLAAEKARKVQDLIIALRPAEEKNIPHWTESTLQTLVEKYRDKFLGFKPSQKETISLLTGPAKQATFTKILDWQMSTIKSAKEYLELTNPDQFYPGGETAAGLAGFHEKNLHTFLAFHPSDEEIRQLQLQCHSGKVIEELIQKLTILRKSVREMLADLSLPLTNATHGIRSSAASATASLAKEFMALQPSMGEKQRFLELAGYKGSALPILFADLASATNAMDFLARLPQDSGYVDFPYDFKHARDKLLSDHLDKFLSFHPTEVEIREFRKSLDPFGISIENVSSTIASHARSTGEILASMEFPPEALQSEADRSRLHRVTRNAAAKFFALHPTVAQAATFRELAGRQVVLFPYLSAEIEKAKTVRDFFSLLPDPPLKRGGVYAGAWAGFAREHLQKFLSLHPSREELAAFRTILQETHVLTDLARELFARAKTAEDILIAMDRPAAADERDQLKRISLEALPRFVSLSPTAKEVEQLKKSLADYPMHLLPVLDEALSKASSALEILAVLPDDYEVWREDGYYNARERLLLKYMDKFLASQPTAAELDRFKQEHRVGDVLQEVMERSAQMAKSPAELNHALRISFETTDFFRLKVAAMALKALPRMIDLHPTADEWQRYLQHFPVEPGYYRSDWELRALLTEIATAVEALAKAENKNPLIVTKIRDVILNYLQIFSEKNNEQQELLSFLMRVMQHPQKGGFLNSLLASAQNNADGLQVLQVCKLEPQICQENAAIEKIQKRLALFSWPKENLVEVISLDKEFKIVGGLIRNQLLQTSTAEEFFDLLDFSSHYAQHEGYWKSALGRLLNEAELGGHFSAIRPSLWQKARYERMKTQHSVNTGLGSTVVTACSLFFSKK